jgi:hypothetical protein
VGEGVTIWLRFRDPLTRAPLDPEAPVVVRVDPPAQGASVPATRVLAAEREELGVYKAQTPADLVGRWMVHGLSGGAPATRGAWEGAFDVRASRMR